MQGISWLAGSWLASQEGLCSMESEGKIHGLRFIFWEQNAVWAYNKTQYLSIWTTQPAHRILWWYNHRSEIINSQSAITLHMPRIINTMFKIHVERYSVNVLDSWWKRSKFFEFEDSYSQGSNGVQLGEWLPTSRRNIVPSPSGSSSLRSCGLKQSRMTALPWKWIHYVPLKYQDLLTQCQGITFMKTWTIIYATVRTSNLLNFISWGVSYLPR